MSANDDERDGDDNSSDRSPSSVEGQQQQQQQQQHPHPAGVVHRYSSNSNEREQYGNDGTHHMYDGNAGGLRKRRRTSGNATNTTATTADTVGNPHHEYTAAVHQAVSANQGASHLLQNHQAGAMFGMPSASMLLSPANVLLAHQLQQQHQQQGGTAQSLQQMVGGGLTNEQQQLAMLLQQQIWGGFTAASNPLLAQRLTLNLQQNAPNISSEGSNQSNQNPASLLSTPQGIQALLNSVAYYSAQNSALTIAQPAGAVPGNNTAGGPGSQYLGIPTSGAQASNNPPAPAASAVQNLQDGDPHEGGLTGRLPVVLYITCDDDSLSEYQCLVRKQIELFEASREDAESNAQGRNRPIVLGQVGIRCRHCTMLPPKHRARGAVYYPAKLHGIYQAAQNLAAAHLGEHCQHVPDNLRQNLTKLRERKSSAGGGKKYWADGVRVLGVFEDAVGLRFQKR